jgi:cytochrome c oxidase subunit I+III
VFPIFAGFYFWYPKMIGRLMDEKLGQISFWLIFAGFNITFFPMHISGLLGMPRRIYTYQPGLGWDVFNLISTIGSYILSLGILVTIINFIWSHSHGQEAGPDPWQGESLEWATESPPEPYNFRVIPTVRSRNPLWDQRDDFGRLHLDGVYNEEHQTLGSSLLDAHAQSKLDMPHDTLWPLAAALCLGIIFVGLLLSHIFLCWLGGVLLVVSVNGWLWPTKEFFEK